MEANNGLPGGMFSSMGSGMLGLEMPLHQPPQQQQNPQNPHHLQQQHHQTHPQMVAFAHHEAAKQGYPYATKPKQQQQQQQQLALSDEDEPGGFTGDDIGGDGKRKVSPWQRMKWTDGMVRLLIMAVYYIGDEGGSEGTDPAGKKKAGGGLLQKKGKWKSVSRAMMEKGFYVSPQQCEDKFNDLNKRYKRVNDILGKGTACRVVENQSLLDTMDQLSPKMKEEVRKLLNSKHLFFREMCAYHSSCGGGGGGGGAGAGAGAHHSPEMASDPSHHQQVQQQRCFHSPEHAAILPNSGRAETEGSKMVKGGSGEEDEEEDEDDEDDDDDEDEDEEEAEGSGRGQNEHGHEDDDDNDERSSRKRQRKEMFSVPSPIIQQLSSEMIGVLQDGVRSPWEKRQWMKSRLMQLEEQRVNFQCQAFELEKQRLKWVKFSSKKEREMERAKLKNDRMTLENERMMLLLRKKELELLDLHQQQQSACSKRGDPSPISG